MALSATCLDYALSCPHTTVTAVTAGDGIALLVQDGQQQGLLVTHSNGLRDAAALLETMGCDKLDYLLVGEGESDRAGGLSYLLEQADVARVLCADSALWATGISVTALSAGDRYGTNEISWTYLGNGWRLDLPHSRVTVGGQSPTVFVPADETPLQYITTAKEWRRLSWL